MAQQAAAGIAQTPRPATIRAPRPDLCAAIATAIYNFAAKASSHSFILSAFCEGPLTTSHCLHTAGVPRITTHRTNFTNHHSLITTHAPSPANVTMLQAPPALHQSPLTTHQSRLFNRQPARLEIVISHRKQTTELSFNRQLLHTLKIELLRRSACNNPALQLSPDRLRPRIPSRNRALEIRVIRQMAPDRCMIPKLLIVRRRLPLRPAHRPALPRPEVISEFLTLTFYWKSCIVT